MRLTTLLVAGAWLSGSASHGRLAYAQGIGPATAVPPVTSAVSATKPTPSDIIQSAAQHTLIDIQFNRAAYRKDPARLRPLVDKYLLPNFDKEYAARLVLGRYWQSATAEQRKRFLDAFYLSLLANYGAALLELTPDRLKVFPTRVEPTAERATVRTEVMGYNAERIAMNYSMHKTTQGWKVYDVSVEGISYIKSYHDDFGARLEQQGLDSLIAHLEDGERSANVSNIGGAR